MKDDKDCFYEKKNRVECRVKEGRIRYRLTRAVMVLFLVFGGFIGGFISSNGFADAAAAKVNYNDGVISIKPGSHTVKKYAYVTFIKAKDESAAKTKADKLKASEWDKYPYVETDGVKCAQVDISSLAAKKPSYVAYKLNSNEAYALAVIQGQITNLKVVYNPGKIYDEMNGGTTDAKKAQDVEAFTFRLKNAKTGTQVDSDAIQMRKQNGDWVSYSAISVKQIANFHMKGASVYFRIGADQMITASDKNYWPSKQVKLKLAKRAKGRSVSVDGSKLTAGVKKDQEYSFDGVNWVNVMDAHGTKNSSGKNVVNPVSIYNMYQTFDKTDRSRNVIYPMDSKLQDPSPVAFYVRTAATEKRPASKEVTCELTQSVQLTKELLPEIGYQLNYSTKSGIQVTNATTSALQIAVVDSSKIFATPAATGAKKIKFKVETAGENQDTVVVPVNEASESEVLTGEAINGECFDLAASKGDNKIPWIDIAKGTAEKPKVTKISDSKYSAVPVDKRIILVRFKSVPKTKTEAMKIASDIVALSMPVSEKQTLAVSSITGLSGTDTQCATGVSITVGSGATATKEFQVSVNAAKMNAEYVPVSVSWVDAQGNAGTKPAGVTVACSGSDRIHAGTGKVTIKINKKTKTGKYYAKLKAESASVIIEVDVYNGNPVIEFETSALSVSGSGNCKITVYGVAQPGIVSQNNYGTVKYELYRGDTVSGSSIIGTYNSNMGFSSWETVEDSVKGTGYKGSFWVDKVNGGSSMPSGTYCLEVIATNATGTTSEKMIIRLAE